MKVAKTADWRDAIGFDSPMLVSDLVPGEATRCSVCGNDSQPLSRTELWAVKHRHPHHHDGYVRFYCVDHVPREKPVVARTTPRATAPGERRPPVRRTPAASDTVRAMCPDCFIEISATGLCGNCGQQVA